MQTVIICAKKLTLAVHIAMSVHLQVNEKQLLVFESDCNHLGSLNAHSQHIMPIRSMVPAMPEISQCSGCSRFPSVLGSSLLPWNIPLQISCLIHGCLQVLPPIPYLYTQPTETRFSISASIAFVAGAEQLYLQVRKRQYLVYNVYRLCLNNNNQLPPKWCLYQVF